MSDGVWKTMIRSNAFRKISVLILVCTIITLSVISAAAEETTDSTDFNVVQFGATGDGITDDGAAIQDAFDACNAADGGTVYFPSGTYCISKTVFFYSNQKIVFEDGVILKRIANSENSGYTCGVFLCNWFETADTTAQTSAIACENVEITGGIFDAGGAVPSDSPADVAMINTCHAENIYIKNCSFINNYHSHCIEINSSENVYIENCSFSDYIGSADSMRYNEMIQIDKAVNGGFGLYFDQEYRTLKGYYSETRIDENEPDCMSCRNINIYGCTFYANEYCSAIGNHHESAYSSVNTEIKIYDNTFCGGSGERGYITFDKHTTDIEIYNNSFTDGKCGVTTNRNEANCIIHDNTFENCKTAYKGSYTAYLNSIDGTVDADSADNAITDKDTASTENNQQDNSLLARLIRFFETLIEMIKALFKG